MENPLDYTDERENINEYGAVLSKLGIKYQETPWLLFVGEPFTNNSWEFYLSSTTGQMESLVTIVAPLLFARGISFAVIKNETLVRNANGLYYGEEHAAKAIIIFTNKIEDAKWVAEEMQYQTAGFTGPEPAKTLRLGHILFTNYVEPEYENGQVVSYNYSVPKKHPFKIPKEFRKKRRVPILAGRYVPIGIIKDSPKVKLYKTVDIKGVAFKPCVLKIVRIDTHNDENNRRILSKLIWQKHVIEQIQDALPVPKILNYFRRKNNYYMVTELINSITVEKRVKDILSGSCYSQIPDNHKKELLKLYLECIRIILQVHDLGYYHRDITPINFLVDINKTIWIIDFELAYNIEEKLPTPPYGTGTHGYYCLEQSRKETPTISQEAYALGCLLFFVCTGFNTMLFIGMTDSDRDTNIREAIQNELITDIIIRCLEVDPEKRPLPNEISLTVTLVLKELNEPVNQFNSNLQLQEAL